MLSIKHKKIPDTKIMSCEQIINYIVSETNRFLKGYYFQRN